MNEKKLNVPFSYEDFDIHYLESLSHDFSKYDGDGRLIKKEFVRWLIDDGTKKRLQSIYFMLLIPIMMELYLLTNFDILHKFNKI